MSLSPVQQAQVDVANAVGADLTYLNPPGERHFDPVTGLYAFAAGLLGAYAKGLIEELGKLTAPTMVAWIEGLFAEPEAKQAEELDRLAAQLKDALARPGATEVEAHVQITTQTLEQSLVVLGFPHGVAVQKARAVQKVVQARLLAR
jgi:hypothetical protein